MKKKLTEVQKKNLKVLSKRALVFLIACAILLCTLFFENAINCFFNKTIFYLDKSFVSSQLKVHFIDVGQGDCTFLQVGDKSIMIDAGTPQSASHIKDYLDNLGFKTGCSIDYLILTHTDSDHIGGAADLLDFFRFKNIFRPKVYSTFEVDNNLATQDFNIYYSNLWREVCTKIYSEVNYNKIHYNFEGQSIVEENFLLNFYSPFEDKCENSNDYSPIMILQSNSLKFAFVGDASIDVEQRFLKSYNAEILQQLFDCDVLKVGHHGSSSSTSEQFLDALTPEVAVISCSRNNSYNHPSDEVVNRLKDKNICVLRTDTMESIVIFEDNGKLNITSGYMSINGIYIQWKYILISAICILFCIIFLRKITLKDKKIV